MNKSNEIYRQGDVLLRRVASIPAGAKEVARDQGRVVLAYGEVTGHAHAIVDEGAVLLSVAESATFLRLTKGARLIHEEHATIALPAGDYQVVRQREYRPWGEVRVAD